MQDNLKINLNEQLHTIAHSRGGKSSGFESCPNLHKAVAKARPTSDCRVHVYRVLLGQWWPPEDSINVHNEGRWEATMKKRRVNLQSFGRVIPFLDSCLLFTSLYQVHLDVEAGSAERLSEVGLCNFCATELHAAAIQLWKLWAEVDSTTSLGFCVARGPTGTHGDPRGLVEKSCQLFIALC